jgi:hypothetical protein
LPRFKAPCAIATSIAARSAALRINRPTVCTAAALPGVMAGSAICR